jgi:hypothetical protein
MLAGDHLIRCGDDRVGFLGGQQPQALIDGGASALDAGQRVDQLARHAVAGNVEVLQRALRLRAP